MIANRTTTAANAVIPSMSSRWNGAISMTNVARSHVAAVARIGRADPGDQRPSVVRRAAGLEGAEQDRDEQHRLETLSEENRERERECEQRRRNPLVRERTIDLAQTLLNRDRVGPHGRERVAVANPVPELGELEFQVEDEVRVAQPERNLCELEVIEVRGPGDVVRTFAVACRGS